MIKIHLYQNLVIIKVNNVTQAIYKKIIRKIRKIIIPNKSYKKIKKDNV